MSEVNPQLVKTLREKTNAGMMDCKRALDEAGGDLDKAETILRTKGIAGAAKKATRATKEGIVAAYIHLQGKVGVLVEVNCETDFVAKNDNFREFVKDITLHIAAAHPLYVTRDQVPAASFEREKEIYRGQVKGKPAAITEKIVEGKLEKFYSTVCLLDQAFIKNPDVTVQRPDRQQDRRAGREHGDPPFHPLHGGRGTGRRCPAEPAEVTRTAPEITMAQTNVLGGPLECCCLRPLTGFYRDGYCRTGPGDVGLHTVCVEVTDEFLAFSRARGNDLSTPVPGVWLSRPWWPATNGASA
jgi:elongation factor Ts